MVRDILGSVLATLAFSLVLYAPGYLVAFSTNVFSFRSMRFSERSLWAVACSFCLSPITAHLIGRTLGLNGVCWMFGLAGVAVLPLLVRSSFVCAWSRSERWTTFAVVIAWTALVLLLLVDMQVGKKLYYSVVMADQSYRIAFTGAVVRTGIPPANPLYFAGTASPMRYYYFWYVLCSVIVKLAHVSARQAFIASSVWAGLGLTVAVKLFASHFFHWSRRTSWIAVGLLLVTGADLLPALGNLFLQSSLNGNSEWWSVDQIDAWPDSILWVPHHVASVLCCLFAFLFLWVTSRDSKYGNKIAVAVLAAAACASAFGLSVYVAIGFMVLMTAWVIRSFLTRRPSRMTSLRLLAVTACLSAILLTPFLRELLSGAPVASTGGPKHLLWFSVRPLIDSGLVTSLPVFASWNRAHPLLLDQSVRLLLLLPGLAMELGLYGVVLLLLLFANPRRGLHEHDDARGAAIFLATAGLVMTMFISSSLITNNDFGYRAVMLPQFFLTLLAAEVITDLRSPPQAALILTTLFRRRLVVCLLLIGIAGSMYWAVLLRAWLPIEAAQATSGFQQSPEDAFQVREAFGRLNNVVPDQAVVAFRDMDLDVERKDMEVMTPTEFFQRMLVLNSGRQILNAEKKCATHFGGDPTTCAAMKQDTLQLYASPSPSAAWAEDYCRRRGVQYLLLTIRDPAWNQRSGWSEDLPVVAEEPRLKIMQCATSPKR